MNDRVNRDDLGRRARKTVTVVFADLVGSTALAERLDPESLDHVLASYYAHMRGVLEQHGGTVEKFIGDAVVGVFGVPTLHEDDALRAIRAAIQMRDQLPDLNASLQERFGVGLSVRIGIGTGEVVSDRQATGHALVAGGAGNLAARLQAAAPTGEILIAAATRRLVSGAVRLEPQATLVLRGVSGRRRTWRVVQERPQPALARPGAAMVGRRRQLRALRRRAELAFERERLTGVMIVGEPGVGKSRLIRELVAELGDDARVAVGRCLSYGDGVAYWPLAEMTRGLAGGVERERLGRLLGGGERAEAAAATLAAAGGGNGSTATAQEVQWAFRLLLEAASRRRPLVAVFDDVHWADPAMLDLIEYLAGYAGAARVLLVCLSRPDLLDRRPALATMFGRGGVVRVEPLSAAESARLLRGLVARRRLQLGREEILARAEGNPLFLKHYVALRADDPAGRPPPTIQALLAARIDALPAGARRVAGAASVEGRGFHRGALEALVGADADVDDALEELTRRELIRPGRSGFPGDEGYRFAHILVRDASYELLVKQARSDLHAGYADWLESRDPIGRELDEIVGYHLEQAFRYRVELGQARADDPHDPLAQRASVRLRAAGRRTALAGDRSGAAHLLRRAAELRPAEDGERADLLIDLGGVLREEGQLAEAESALAAAIRIAAGGGDQAVDARAQVERLLARVQVDPDRVARLAERNGARLELALEEAGDRAGMAKLWHLRALLAWIRASSAEAEQAWRRAAIEAELAGDQRMVDDARGWEASSMYSGPTPVDAAIERCLVIVAGLSTNRWAAALALLPLAGLRAMRGELDAAIALLDESRTALAEFGPTLDGACIHPAEVTVLVLRGDLGAAERRLRASCRELDRMGERAVLASTEGYLAQVLLDQGRIREAGRSARRCRDLAAAGDVSAQVLWRQAQARVLLAGDRLAAAEQLAREAVDRAERTDWLGLLARALTDLAIVLAATGPTDEAASMRRRAAEAWQRKGGGVTAAIAEAGPSLAPPIGI